jgi:protocatechuate 3,4-dioxygenase beta subunit
MKALKVLSLILICATMFRIATAQTMAKENTKAANQARHDGVITVRVVNDTGQPIAGAPILVNKAGDKGMGGLRIGNADDEGEFKATELGPGSYKISTIVPGYVVALTDSERNHHHPGENVTINLVKGGVITGRVTDAYGKPMVGVGVMAFKVRDLEGGQKYHGDGADWNTRLTDDRGVYRLYGLAPGVYVVGASSDQSGLYGGFYPGREAMDVASVLSARDGQGDRCAERRRGRRRRYPPPRRTRPHDQRNNHQRHCVRRHKHHASERRRQAIDRNDKRIRNEGLRDVWRA